MIVYSHNERTEDVSALLAGLKETCAVLASAPTGAVRVAALTRLLLEAGELAQGVLDAAFTGRGEDDWGELEHCCGGLTLAAARLYLDGATGAGGVEHFLSALQALADLPLPGSVTVKVPEGYAFYALYPELYARAARKFRARYGGPLAVVGLRSIGTSLAAIVAAAAEAGPPVTLRPVGHPFQRTVRLSPRLEQELLGRRPETHFAVVDEGPGLSGSSFGTVGDWLEEHGVAPDHIHFYPGHGGDLGPMASPRHRQRWRESTRHVEDFETLLWGQETLLGASWFEDGIPLAALGIEDLSGGKWRARSYEDEGQWPPSNTTQERRKYLYPAHGRTWLAKFAGLGRYGEKKLGRARLLGRAGLVPPVRDLRHGFLIGEWLMEARPYRPGRQAGRAALLETVTRYLAFLARECAAGEGARGASPVALFEMARFNTQEALGPEMAAGLDRWREDLPALAQRRRPVLTDNKMHAREWLSLPDGRWLKADALDHHAAHDLVGAQDLAWDVAGAAVELDLTPAEQEELERRLAAGCPFRPDPLATAFYRLCYLAFQMGSCALASAALGPGQPAEAARMEAARRDYAEGLRRAISERMRG